AGISPRQLAADDGGRHLLEFEPLGNVTLLHMTDPHATLLPVFYREPDTLIGIGAEKNQPPFVTGQAALRAWRLAPGTPEAYAYTYLDFAELAARYGRLGGYAHLATLVRRIREERPGRTLLLDGGDTLQGSATALWSRGEDMVRAMNLLGVEVATAHWEFMYGIERVRELFGDAERRGLFAGDFVAQNVSEAGFGDRVFKPYTVRHVGGVNVAVIGQAFPYTVVAHPKRLVGDLTFGIREDQVQALIDEARDRGKADIVVLLSHNGISVDLKLAARVTGLDVILGGHTHDALVEPIRVRHTLVVNSGSHGKFLSRLDLDVRSGRIVASRYRLIPVLTRLLPENPAMARLIEDVADNLFHPDPYYRQGGDMVRVGGVTYAIDPGKAMGRRITDVRVGGRPLDPARRYKATGWASLGEASGPPAWDVVAAHLRSVGHLRLEPRPRVRVV